MAGLNKVMLIGNLGRDPEVKHLEGGIAVATFSLATTEYYRDKNNEKREQTEWHHIAAWRANAEFAEKYIKKGYTVYVEGKLRTRSWEDKEGHKKYQTEIVVDDIRILHRPNSDSSASSNIDSSPSKEAGDLPF